MTIVSTIQLNQMPCTELKGVGPRLKTRLEKIGIFSVQDLLFHLPRVYQDRTRIMSLGSVHPGQQVAIEGNIELAEIVFRGRRQLICYLSDKTSLLALRFFHFNPMQYESLKQGLRIRCFGEVRFGKKCFEMIHPEYRILQKDEIFPVEETLTPIYPTTEGIHQLTWRKLIKQTLNFLKEKVILQELLPAEILSSPKCLELVYLCRDRSRPVPTLSEALSYVHQPPADASIALLNSGHHPCQQRLIFEELLAHHLSLRKLREHSKKHQAISLKNQNHLTEKFLKQLPFTLTRAQQRVLAEILDDLSQLHPMMRLLQGDVGSGKTVIAALAAILVADNQCQTAIMAPTEILAEQHLNNFARWFKPFNINIAWLTSRLKGKSRALTLEKIKNGEAQIIIGTHALFQEDVHFKKPALIIIDEQHRFGVHQRLALREKGNKNNCYPHQLIMTATPIPRTLAMSAYADLDHSIIDEMPPGRKPITTTVISNARRNEIIARIQKVCDQKQQVYWVCPLIEESEILQCEAAEKTVEMLKPALKPLNIALIHGRLKSKDKDQIMSDFKAGKYDLLVATTVIEVGVDVPNASLMVIENAERLGLAQLHQLRGRIGRGNVQSHCVLLYQTPLSQNAKKRLDVMRKSCDGFLIAEKDLEIRGPGEVLGTKQSGIIEMRIANLLRDQKLLPEVQEAAKIILKKYSNLIPFIEHRWILDAEKYGRV